MIKWLIRRTNVSGCISMNWLAAHHSSEILWISIRYGVEFSVQHFIGILFMFVYQIWFSMLTIIEWNLYILDVAMNHTGNEYFAVLLLYIWNVNKIERSVNPSYAVRWGSCRPICLSAIQTNKVPPALIVYRDIYNDDISRGKQMRLFLTFFESKVASPSPTPGSPV